MIDFLIGVTESMESIWNESTHKKQTMRRFIESKGTHTERNRKLVCVGNGKLFYNDTCIAEFDSSNGRVLYIMMSKGLEEDRILKVYYALPLAKLAAEAEYIVVWLYSDEGMEKFYSGVHMAELRKVLVELAGKVNTKRYRDAFLYLYNTTVVLRALRTEKFGSDDEELGSILAEVKEAYVKAIDATVNRMLRRGIE